jgi:hypothetical protein
MQNIKSPEEVKKSKQRTKMIVGGALIFLMAFSSLGFALNGSFGGSTNDQSQDGPFYNGQFWVYDLDGGQFFFSNSVESVRAVPIESSPVLQSYVGEPLFIDSSDELILSEIASNLGRFASRTQRACYGECEEDLPEKGCDENLIIWRESEEPRIYQEQNCVFIEGDSVAVDAFLYRLLGVI